MPCLEVVLAELLVDALVSLGYPLRYRSLSILLSLHFSLKLTHSTCRPDDTPGQARYPFDRWRLLDTFLRENVDTVGLRLYLRLLASESEFILSQVRPLPPLCGSEPLWPDSQCSLADFVPREGRDA